MKVYGIFLNEDTFVTHSVMTILREPNLKRFRLSLFSLVMIVGRH